jgi:hypothetical protein
MSRAGVVLGAIIVGTALAGCATTPESYEQRMHDTYAFIDRWEAALHGQADDRGWSMLSGAAQRGFTDREQYVELATATDWSAFEIVPLTGFCDDLYACSISVLVAGDVDAVPGFLLRAPQAPGELAARMVQFADADDDGVPDEADPQFGNAYINVWWERVPWSDPGIGGSS